jgi:hypothetical protein
VRLQGLWAVDQSVDVAAAAGTVWVSFELVEVAVGVGESTEPNVVEERLVEIPIAELRGKVVHGREAVTGLAHDSVEKSGQSRIGSRGGMVEPIIQDTQHRPDLLGHALMGASDAEQRNFELPRWRQARDTEVTQRLP